MKKITGLSASQGIAIGKVFYYLDEYLHVPEYRVDEEDLDIEWERFEAALDKTRNELIELKDTIKNEQNAKEAGFLDAHILMLDDPELSKEISLKIKTERYNAEWALFETVKKFIDLLQGVGDQYIKERTFDIKDVARRVLGNLLYKNSVNIQHLNEEVILIAHELMPSDTLSMDKRMVKGIATDSGGKTSHTAILARAFEIPAVLGLRNITAEVKNGDQIIVDGSTGTVIIEPDEDTLAIYRNKLSAWQKKEVELLNLNQFPAETRDGRKILLHANIEVPEETDSVLSHGADGIGLYRSEFFFIQPGEFATEEQQFQAYSKVLSSMENKPVTIRTIDLGGDKILPGTAYFEETNPILGWKSIRFCMTRTDIFSTQLRALLRSSVHGNLRIMFPMISGIEELENVLSLYGEVMADLDSRGVDFDHNIPIGIMIEVPSAALTADVLAKKVKFFSIGTNDLIQYTIAVDRGNEKIAYLYEPFHPGVLRLLKMIIEGAHSESIPVAMCGEMAGDPYAAVILLGLGLDVFSMSSFSIPEIKNIIRSVSMVEAEELVGTVFDMKSYNEIDRFIKGWMNERFEYLREQ